MLSPLHRRLLDELRRALSDRFGDRLRRVCVFGSWARGEATERSDLDVAIVVDGLSASEWREALSIATEVQLEVDAPCSPFIVSAERLEALRARGGIGAHIVREGLS